MDLAGKIFLIIIMLVLVTYILSALYELINKMLFWRYLKKFKGKFVLARVKRDYETGKFLCFYYITRISENGWSAGKLTDNVLTFNSQGEAVKELVKYECGKDLIVLQIKGDDWNG